MIRFRKFTALILLMTSGSVPALQAQPCENPGDSAAAGQILERRQAFNAAIAQADAAAIESILDENVVLITGTDSDLFLGREAQTALWREDFERPDRAIYVRTGQCVRVSPAAPVALEWGAWRGVSILAEDDFAAGRYAAKWRKQDGDWWLESEIFATEECGGRFCPDSASSP
jgi:ketosteroid isomerase-like protein